jgi:hypothetical protein
VHFKKLVCIILILPFVENVSNISNYVLYSKDADAHHVTGVHRSCSYSLGASADNNTYPADEIAGINDTNSYTGTGIGHKQYDANQSSNNTPGANQPKKKKKVIYEAQV